MDAPEEVDEQVVRLDEAVEEPVEEEQPTFGTRLTGLRPWLSALLAFLLYLALSFIAWGVPAVGAFTTRYVGFGGTDKRLYQWSLAWTPWALAHGASPLFTPHVFAPDGLDLTWTTFMPSLGVVGWPITALFGPIVTLNVFLILAPALAAWAAFLLCRRVTKHDLASLLGGLAFGSCAFITGHMVGHLNLVAVFPVPLAAYLVVRRVEGSLGPVTFVAGLAACLAFLFGVSTELFATATFFAVVASVIALVAAGGERIRLLKVGLLIVLSYAIVAALWSPFVSDALKTEPDQTLRVADETSVDLLSFVVPRRQDLVDPHVLGGNVALRFTAAAEEDAAYVGIAMLVLLVAFAVTERRRRGTIALLAFVGVVWLFALGPVLHIKGRGSTGLPGAFMADLPLLKHATAQRFPVYASLAIAVIVALWVARARGKFAALRWALAGVAVIAILPQQGIASDTARIPTFFTDGTSKEVLHDGENVFTITDRGGTELTWQAAADFTFALPEAYVGPVPPKYVGNPLFRGLSIVQRNASVPAPGFLLDWLHERGVTAVVLSDTAAWKFLPLMQSTGMEQVYAGGGVTVWRDPPEGPVVDDPAAVVIQGDPDHGGGLVLQYSLPSLTGGDRIVGPGDARTLLTFVGPDCGSCVAHLQALDAYARADPSIDVLAVSSWDPDRINAELLSSLDLSFPIGEDPLGRMAAAFTVQPAHTYDQPTPFSVFLTENGIVRQHVDGVWPTPAG